MSSPSQRTSAETMTVERLVAFGDAWNARDLDQIMSYFSEDCVYFGSFGPSADGTPYVGHEAVREGVSRFLARYPDGRYSDVRSFVVGERGASEWTFTATGPDGRAISVRGCDLFEFSDGKIKKKDAFRKEWRPEAV
jgi:ketosteroid isomerase-like protein